MKKRFIRITHSFRRMIPNLKLCLIISAALTMVYLYLITFFAETPNYCPLTWPENQTRDIRKLIRPTENTFNLIPTNVCDGDKNHLLLLIVVTSAINNFDNRQAIRESWGKELKEYDSKVKMIFLVGEESSNYANIQQNIVIESDQHRDILQASFTESYYNLTIKSLNMLKWFSETCQKQNYEYLMKVDDDVYINIDQVYDLIIENTHPNILTGFIHCGIMAQTEGKSCLPPFMLTGYNKNYWLYRLIGVHWYPNYLAGPAYLMSKSTADILYKTAMTVPALHMEDVYVTGMLPSFYNQAGHLQNTKHSIMPFINDQNSQRRSVDQVHPIGDERFNIQKVELDPCKYANLISSHDLNHTEMTKIHKLITDLRETPDYKRNICSNYSAKKEKISCFWDMDIF